MNISFVQCGHITFRLVGADSHTEHTRIPKYIVFYHSRRRARLKNHITREEKIKSGRRRWNPYSPRLPALSPRAYTRYVPILCIPDGVLAERCTLHKF
jgi:hypothetical protein